MTIRTFGELLGEGIASFEGAFAAETRWHFPRAIDAERAKAMIPIGTIDRLIASGALPANQLRVLIKGAEAMQSLYTSEHGLRTEALQSFLRQGATLSISDVGKLLPGVGMLAASIERRMGARCGVNAYLSVGGEAAFRPHTDGHDVLVLQCQGAKRWFSHGAPQSYPLIGRQMPNAPAPVWEAVMEPGDILFLPRGEIHSTQPVTPPSVHLTFSLSQITGVDVMEALAREASNVCLLRRGIGTNSDSAGKRTQELKEALHELVEGIDIGEFLRQDARRRGPRPVFNLQAGADLAESEILVTALRRKIDLVEDAAEPLAIEIGDKRLQLSQMARKILGEVSRRDYGTVSEIASALCVSTGDSSFREAIAQLMANALLETVS